MSRIIFFCVYVALVCCISTTKATEVRWTPGSNDPNDAAATAPKSQKYWDEHGIKRPDYAKTDAEIAQERGAKSDGSWSTYAMPLVAVAGIAYWVFKHQDGSRLDGSYLGLFKGRVSDEEARRARLARFEANGSKAE